MTKTALVKIGVPSAQAESLRRLRTVRQVLDQHEAAMRRLEAATLERLKEITTTTDVDDDQPAAVANAG